MERVKLLKEITLNVDTVPDAIKAVCKVVGPMQGEYYVLLGFKIVAILCLLSNIHIDNQAIKDNDGIVNI